MGSFQNTCLSVWIKRLNKEAIMKRNKKRGFTLLELLMVVIIIAILASIALPQYLKASEKSRASEALTMLGAIREAEFRYKAQSPTNIYTNQLNELDTDFNGVNQLYWAFNNIGNTFAAGTGAKGVSTAKRIAGSYAGQILGLSFGNGQTCGNFNVIFPAIITCGVS